MWRNLLVYAAALLAASACGPISARPLVALSVVDRDSGQWLPSIPYRGEHWLPGTPGHRYAVRLANQTGERLLVVLSVDGVNAVSGQTADPSQAGYVLDPWTSAQVDGWRKSLDEVAQFVFTDLGDAYATRTGRPDDVGVIGIAVFREAQAPVASASPPMPREDARAPSAPSTGQASADEAADVGIARQRIGTGHGERQWAPVAQAAFLRASPRPAQVTQWRYDAMDSLLARGILRRPCRGWRAQAPQAFPGGFVPDPPSG